MGRLVEGKWTNEWYTPDEQGRFVRGKTSFRDRVSADGSSGYPAEAGRYHLYVSYACPWAHRTLILRKLKGLEEAISVSVVDPFMGDEGWVFSDGPGCTPDTIGRASALWQVYVKARSDYTGRVTVPVLWDKQKGTIVNNESREIARMLDTAFDAIGDASITLYPEGLGELVDRVIDLLYEPINNGVYRAGFATTQLAYEEAVTQLFEALDHWEEVLDEQRYLCGDVLTEADVFFFTTLVRFDAVYYSHFKCNLRRIAEYPNLWGYVRDIYQTPGVSETCRLDHIKQHYYRSHERINPSRIVPKGPILDFDAPHDRERRFGPTKMASPPQKSAAAFAPEPSLPAEVAAPALQPPEPASVASEQAALRVDGESKAANMPSGPAPIIRDLDPAHGPRSEVTRVRVSGEHFAEGCVALVNGARVVAAREGERRLMIDVPASAKSGHVDICVENPDGKSALWVNAFHYDAAPRVASVDPTAVPVAGGTKLTLLGDDFAEGCAVEIGGVALEMRRIDATHIEAVTMARPSGEVDVVVRNPDGQTAIRASAVRFVEPPVITSLSPANALFTGGDWIRILGRNFTPGTLVKFGRATITEVEFVNEGELVIEAPSHEGPGPVDVGVVTPLGLSHRLPLAFSYSSPAPVITSVSPAAGPGRGGTQVTLEGRYFDPGSTVYVCGIEAHARFESRERIEVTTPPLPRGGLVDIRIINPDDQACVAEKAFRYEQELTPPTVASIHPARGSQIGGLKVFVYGENFAEPCQVRFGGAPVEVVKFMTSKQLEVLTPAHGGAGTASVEVENPDGQSATLEAAFIYEAVPGPVITGIRPLSGPTTGGTRLVIEGEHFAPNSHVYIGRDYPKDMTVKSAHEIHVVTAPRKTPGVVDVEVSVPGLPKAVMKNGFRYDAVPGPTITGVSPNRGGTGGGTELTISGSNFLQESVVLVGGKQVKAVKFVDKSTLEIKTPPGDNGAMVDIVVRHPDGKEAVQKRAFMYDARYG